MSTGYREGSLEAPTRHKIDWKQAEYYSESSLFEELERVFDICHGCRRCFNLCNAFPTLFDAIDESESMELDGVDRKDYWPVVDHCYLCDMCYMTKCPYVPPHEWNIDFPHLMLRAKAVKFKKNKPSLRDRLLSSTDFMGQLAKIPLSAYLINTLNQWNITRVLLKRLLKIDNRAALPKYYRRTLHDRAAKIITPVDAVKETKLTKGKVALFATCYGNYNEPDIGEALLKILQHNNIQVVIVEDVRCCGMPKLEMGDLESVEHSNRMNNPVLSKWVNDGWDIVIPVPSCALMFKQELPLLFSDDQAVTELSRHIFDPFEYLMLRHKEGELNTQFENKLGKISYQVACHLRVQNLGHKTKDCLELVPETQVEVIERCSGHNGTYAVKVEFHDAASKIGKPVVNKIKSSHPDYYVSDCPMATQHIKNGLQGESQASHPLKLLALAYGL